MDVATTPEAQQVIDEQIARLQAEIPKEVLNTRRKTYTRNPKAHNLVLQLKYQRNTYASIFRLTDEILLEICIILRTLWPGLPKYWHQVAHICRHWRRVVVGAPSLWTNPPPNPPDYALLMLERSKLAPLHIYATKPDILPALLKHIRRIQVLKLSLDPKSLEVAQKFFSDMHEEASLLEELSINSNDGWLSDRPGPAKFRFSLPTFRPTNSLRQLLLQNVEFDWRVLPLPSLTHLSLKDISVAARVSGYRFADALSRMPSLELLELSLDDIQLYDYPPEIHPPQIHLPYLSNLDVQHPSLRGQSQWFLSQASLLRLRELQVDWEPGTDLEWRPGMLSQVSLSVERGDFGILDELEFYTDCFRVRPSPQTWQLRQLSEIEEEPRADVGIPFEQYNHHDSGAIVEEIISSIASRASGSDVSSLVRVCITSNISITADQLVSLFGSLPSLGVIGVSSEYVRLLTKALTIESGHLPGILLPFSTIHTVEWHYVGTDDDLKEFGEMDYEELEEFCDCLMLRYEYGLRIDRLEMLECCIKYQQLKVLEGILVTVDQY